MRRLPSGSRGAHKGPGCLRPEILSNSTVKRLREEPGAFLFMIGMYPVSLLRLDFSRFGPDGLDDGRDGFHSEYTQLVVDVGIRSGDRHIERKAVARVDDGHVIHR